MLVAMAGVMQANRKFSAGVRACGWVAHPLVLCPDPRLLRQDRARDEIPIFCISGGMQAVGPGGHRHPFIF